ncbi:NUDIX domain-containing protein [Pectobacterium parmentieri]|uniref:NUDIX domain-containing protein n=1 Tax=Pectobacterium parmentieri TaxID=1905730 RepID=UPI000EB4C03E|nr:NUDIX domain-containing protein [Pectobacterium parmentieri]AYH00912.1 NUDIX pyrophosphatase [Pectobacterium parmentieri]AYH27221.1 NUDIX pyrophosphatase [Pectobacterium parmentieri]AYH31534.1 NUDIX pyrophosphatase [Pectobacterium parmentieri]MBI0519736.1 NUDIX domain-containing protein [Pectobacterium parmentieri]
MREPKQVLIIPYVIDKDELYLYILKRRDMDYWQWVAGGVEENETILDAAIRESSEELGLILNEKNFIQLESVCSIPRCYFNSDKEWEDDFYTVTEYSFAVRLSTNSRINLSNEHSEMNIIKYSDLKKYNTWDSNRTAAWELRERMLMGRL